MAQIIAMRLERVLGEPKLVRKETRRGHFHALWREFNLRGDCTLVLALNDSSEIVISPGASDWKVEVAMVAVHSDLLAQAGLASHTKELQGALQLTADALQTALQGHPVRNAPHCFASAEKLLAGTEFEFRR